MTNVEPHNNSHANQNPNIIHDDEYINQIEVKLESNEQQMKFIHTETKEESVDVKNHNIQDYVDDLFNIEQVLNKKTDTLIIIIKQEINQTLMNILNEFWDRNKIFIILFTLERLQFNILQHQYVPKHVILNEDEKKEMFKRYNILDVKNLPDISRFDPVAQAIGMRPGDICRIERPSKTSVISNYYRYCTQTLL